MAAAIFSHVKAIPPRPDVSHPDSALYGVAKRMAYKPAEPDEEFMKEFNLFVRNWLQENMTPLAQEFDFNFEEWLSKTNYPEWRKQELRKAYENVIDPAELDKNGHNIHSNVKYFVKEEWYPEFKHHRGIWARVDEFKCISGPFFKAIEEELFKLKYFIKKIPKDQRAEYISKMMDDIGKIFQTTDFTAYESHFTTELMWNCEFELYKYMSRCNPKAQQFVRIIFSALAKDNYVINKYFTLAVRAKRMSGEMNTSLGNGFSNLMFLLFACHKYKIDFLGPVVEGDDGLIALSKEIPKEYFDKMALNVKMEIHQNLSDASFCGLVFDPVERIIIRDPRVPISTIMWVPRQYASSNVNKIKGLIKSKALSMMFEYPGCPILAPLSHKVFALMGDVPMINHGDSNYEMNYINQLYIKYEKSEVPYKVIGMRTRKLMERLFDIDTSRQLLIETDIESMTLEHWNTDNLITIMPALWIWNYDIYVRDCKNCTSMSICNMMFSSGTKNIHFKELYTLLRVTGTKSRLNKLIKFKDFCKMNRKRIHTKLEMLAAYDKYVAKHHERNKLHILNEQPINYGQQK